MLEAQTLSNENRLHHKFSIIFEKSIYRIYGNFEYIIDHQSDYVKQRYIYIYIYCVHGLCIVVLWIVRSFIIN